MQTTHTRWFWMMTIGAALLGACEPVAQAALVEHDSTAITDAMLAGIGDLHTLAGLATAPDATLAARARMRLRAAGPAGLDAFVDLHRDAIAAATAPATPGPLAQLLGLPAGAGPNVAGAQLLDTLDEICGQRDCAAAGLYWYTDLESARAAARASGKPILSLRLLGDLRDELSCANSRLFRALLYPDPAVSALLRAQFVLHWHSERPAPKITIDFGDGRSIESTITGNSAHYVLDSEGRVVDALPGLMTPRAFMTGLEQAAALARATVGLDPAARVAELQRHHAARLTTLAQEWSRELAAIGQSPRPTLLPVRPPGLPRAGYAAPIAISKMAMEAPMLGVLGEAVDTLSDAELYDRIAGRHLGEVALSDATVAQMTRDQWRSGDPTRDAADLQRALVELRRAVALDTLRNEHDLHRQIHAMFVADAATLDLERLNRKVYDELFLTPRSDPWLGLAAPTIYSGLAGGGRHVTARL